MDNSAYDAPIVNTRHAMREREMGFDAFNYVTHDGVMQSPGVFQ
jgi:hypothetical protein